MDIFSTFIQNLMCFALFFVAFPKRSRFALRLLSSLALSALALFLISDLLLQVGKLPVFLYYLSEFAILMSLFHLCFQTTWEQALYSASAGRAAQHLIYSILNLIGLRVSELSNWRFDGNPWLTILGSIPLYMPFCAAIYALFARKMDTTQYEKSDFRRQMNLLSVVIVFICMGITRFAKDGAVWDKSTYIAANLYAITCCSLCLIMQSKLAAQARLTQEMEMVRMLWKEDSNQLALRKDTIDLINMKCHDIRHRLENSSFPDLAAEGSELQSLIRIYDQSYHTGNQTLDVLLTDRALLCEKHHIQLSYSGDGSSLNFLSETEVYSLLGNALDNAVEAVRNLTPDRRQISVILRSGGDLLSISVTNYFDGSLQFDENGLPLTTQPNSNDFHGYGMKSMRTIAQKHGGDLAVKADGGVFRLTLWLVSA